MVNEFLTTIVETVQKLDRSTERQLARALVADSSRLAWKINLLGHIAEAARSPIPTGRSAACSFHSWGEQFTELAESGATVAPSLV